MLGAERPSAAELNGWTGLFATFAIVLLVPGFGGAWEEPGWRGYALPRLQSRRSALVAGLILGALIAGWHLPLMVAGQVAYSDVVLIFAGTIVFNWVFNNARGSVLIIMVMHAANNTVSGSFFSPMFTGADSLRQSWLLALVWTVMAILVIAISGPENLSRKYRKQEEALPDAEPVLKQGRNVIMSSRVRWGGIAGLVAATLMIISAILNQMSAGSASSSLYLDVVVLAAYIAIIVAVLGIHALHSGTSRYGRLGTTGAVLTIAGNAIIAVVTVISMVQGQRSLLPVRLTGAGLVLVGSALLGVIIIRARLLPWWCGVLLIVTFPLGHFANALFSSAENLLLALLWGSMGIALLSRRQEVNESARGSRRGAAD